MEKAPTRAFSWLKAATTLMIIASRTQFHVVGPWVTARLAQCLYSVFNVKAVVDAFNLERALVGAFSVITNLQMELFDSLASTGLPPVGCQMRCVTSLPINMSKKDCTPITWMKLFGPEITYSILLVDFGRF